MKKMNNEQLVRLILANRKDSYGALSTELTTNRAEAMDRYHGRPYGDEKRGRSRVTLRDISETIDWAMPAIMRIALQSGRLGEFTPVGPEDEELSKQETDYVNHVILKDNPGFMILHDCIKDGLLLKNMYADVEWTETDVVRERTYRFDDFNQLVYTLSKLKETSESVEMVKAEYDSENATEEEVKKVRFKIKKKLKRVGIDPIPPEEIYVSKRCRGTAKTAPYVEVEKIKSRSDMLEMGMPKDFVDKLEPWAGTGNKADTREATSRDSVSNESDTSGQDIDRSLDDIKYSKVYMKVDFDGDGIAELRCIKMANDKIPDGDEWNYIVDEIPIPSGVTKRVPHRHIGESLYDELKDLTRIKVTLTRQLLDNVYRTNNNEYVINENANLADFQLAIAGGIKRINSKTPVQESAMMMPTQSIADKILPIIDYFKQVQDNRTGINEVSTNIDPDVLRQSTKGALMETISRASQKIEMIARMIAETFFKELMLIVHSTIIKNQDYERIVKMRGKFVPINPDEWEERTDLDIQVGLGTGTSEERLTKLTVLKQTLLEIADTGLVGPEQTYEMVIKIAEVLGEENPEKYIIDPKSPEFEQNRQYIRGLAIQQEGQGNPLAEAERIKGEIKLRSDEMQAQARDRLEQLKLVYGKELEQIKQTAENERERMKQASAERIKAAEMELTGIIEKAKLESQETQKAAELEVKAFIEREKRLDLGKKGVGAGLQDAK